MTKRKEMEESGLGDGRPRGEAKHTLPPLTWRRPRCSKKMTNLSKGVHEKKKYTRGRIFF